ncbi:MAG TPA: GGDEF domain-containing protein [Thermoanaerobaculia bacterium]|nr:GGDEF domain-containing protein [Thermoanaerobaculia bacterium]
MKRGRWITAAGLFVVVATIGWLDYETGPDIGFSLFYLVPIAAASWFLGRVVGIALALAAATLWMAASLAWSDPGMTGIMQWNGFTRLVIYVSIAILVALVREDRDRLGALNAQLSIALGTQTRLARTDRLTNLGNSRHFLEHLALDIQVNRTPVCVAFIDVDNFKRVNDVHGHEAGDDLLRHIAADLGEVIRNNDVAARMGGDEFAILFRGVEPKAASAIGARIIERIRLAGARYPDAGIGASVGIAWFERPPADAKTVLRTADAAMYQAKEAGKGQVRIVVDR